MSGASSTLSLVTVNVPACSPAISSSTGETIRQGAHHSAQKSTNTGPGASRTSLANESYVSAVVVVVDMCRLLRENAGDAERSADANRWVSRKPLPDIGLYSF